MSWCVELYRLDLKPSYSHVLVISDIDVACRVHCDATRMHKLTVSFTDCTYAVQDVSFWAEESDAMATEFGQDVAASEVRSYSNWGAEEAFLSAGGSERVQKASFWIKDL